MLFDDWIDKQKLFSKEEINRKFGVGISLFIFFGVYIKYLEFLLTNEEKSFMYLFIAVFTGFFIICYALYQLMSWLNSDKKSSFIIARSLDWFSLFIGLSIITSPFIFDSETTLGYLAPYLIVVTTVFPVLITFLATWGIFSYKREEEQKIGKKLTKKEISQKQLFETIKRQNKLKFSWFLFKKLIIDFLFFSLFTLVALYYARIIAQIGLSHSNSAVNVALFAVFLSVAIPFINNMFKTIKQRNQYALEKNRKGILFLNESEHNARVMYDLRNKNFLKVQNDLENSISKKITYYSKKRDEDSIRKKTVLEKLLTLTSSLVIDKIASKEDSIEKYFQEFEKIQTIILESDTQWYDEIMSMFKVTLKSFKFDTKDSKQFFNFLKYDFETEKKVKPHLKNYYWYLSIHTYNFELIERHAIDILYKNSTTINEDRIIPSWFINASNSRIRYSKITLKLLGNTLQTILVDPEINFKYEDLQRYEILKEIFFYKLTKKEGKL